MARSRHRRARVPLVGALHSAAAGFSIVESCLTLLLAAIMVYGLHATLAGAITGRATTDRVARVHELAGDILERVRSVPFGTASEPKATASQLFEFFDDDTDLGDVTVHRLAVGVTEPGHTFQVNSEGVVGRFRVKITNDLDGDGKLDGPREGRNDLLHVEIYFRERLVLETLIAAHPLETMVDTDASYLSGI